MLDPINKTASLLTGNTQVSTHKTVHSLNMHTYIFASILPVKLPH